MDKKLLAICILSITAIALMIANFATPVAHADTAISGNGYMLATGRLVGGGEGLYILDNQSGNMVVFTYDANKRQLVPRAFLAVNQATGTQGR
jgi:hypothetical protein